MTQGRPAGPPIEAQATLGGRQQACDDPRQRRFPRAGFANDRQCFTATNVQADAFQHGRARRVSRLYALDAEKGLPHLPPA